MLRIKDVLWAKDLEDALSALEKNPDLIPVAGGTDLMVQLSESGAKMRLLDISSVDEFRKLRMDGNRLFIGSTLTHAEIAESKLVLENAPLIAKSSGIMGGPAIRNRATIGGNIANSSPVAESYPTLIAHGADVVLISKKGRRKMSVEDFHLGPGKNAMAKDELLLGFEVPAIDNSFFGFYERLGSRAALTITKVGVAMGSTKKGNRLSDVRIALSAVAPRVIRAPQSEKILQSDVISPEIIDRAARTLITECTPITDFRSTCDYREDMVGQLFKIGTEKVLIQ